MYTDAQRSAIRAAFVRKRRRQIVLAILLLPKIVEALADKKGETTTVWFFGLSPNVASWVFLVLAVARLLFSLRNWRWPACSGIWAAESIPGVARSADFNFACRGQAVRRSRDNARCHALARDKNELHGVRA